MMNSDNPSAETGTTECFNILLLGETGVGKSTFINAFANYLKHNNLDDALADVALCPIPARFIVISEKQQDVLIEMGKDPNESEEAGSTSTQNVKQYEFKVKDKLIRLIDTPGMGDSRGVDKDNENMSKIMVHLQKLGQLHAIAFMLRSNITIIAGFFKHCLGDLLRQLDVAAAKNFVFIFTHTSGSDYRAPDTMSNLRRMLKDIKVDIPLNADPSSLTRNVFYFDSEGFKHLLASQRGVPHGNVKVMQKSWRVSAQSSVDLVNYVTGLTPYLIPNEDVNMDAIQLIVELLQPLADSIDLIDIQLKYIWREYDRFNNRRGELYLSKILVEIIPKNATICRTSKCKHLKQVCHDKCFLVQMVKALIGPIELQSCDVFKNQEKCLECGCSFNDHKHIYYVVKKTIRDKPVKMTYLQDYETELDNERKIICRQLALNLYFLSRNSSVFAMNDVYEQYLDKCIESSKQPDEIRRLETLKGTQAVWTENIIKSEREKNRQVGAQNIVKSIQKLFQLAVNGPIIKELHDAVRHSNKWEQDQCNKLLSEKLVQSDDNTITESKEFNTQMNADKDIYTSDEGDSKMIIDEGEQASDPLAGAITNLISLLAQDTKPTVNKKFDDALINLLQIRLA